jgi:predicted MFS family arabinose efflux permease
MKEEIYMTNPVLTKKSSPWLVLLLATSCGLIVANLYYTQPLVGPISKSLGISAGTSGLIVTVTQLGYVLGLIFLVPLSDLVKNRRLVLLTLAVAIFALLIATFTHLPAMFFLAALLLGVGSASAQILVPYAAHLSTEGEQGRMVGNVMCGLLLGIMFARPVASFLTSLANWKAIFLFSVVMMAVIFMLLFWKLPERIPKQTLSYKEMLSSLWPIFKNTPVLRRRALYQAALFCSFSLFWTVAPLWLAAHFHLSQTGIALFGLVGVSGAIASPIAGRLADKGWTEPLTTLGFFLAVGSFTLTHLFQAQVGPGLAAFCIAAVVLDMAVSGNLILGQQAIYALGDQAKGRMNGIFMAVFFLGGGLGSAAGGWLYAQGGWNVASLLGLLMPILALIYDITHKILRNHNKKESL